MKSLAFTDEFGERHHVYTRTEEALDAIIALIEAEDLDYEITPEDA